MPDWKTGSSVLFAALLVGLWFLPVDATSVPESPSSSEEEEEERVDPFGIQKGHFTIEEGQVGWGETFTEILMAHGVDYQSVVTLAEETRSTFDVRGIQTGKPYRVYVNPWLQQAQYLVYQLNSVDYVVFDIHHPERTTIGQRPVQRQWAAVGGTIDRSFYETMTENGGHPELALRLSEIFGWQIDFFRIQQGDEFRLIYEQRTVEGEQVEPGEIIAAYFEHQGERYYGFRFDDGNGAEYFDRQGQSLQRQLLKAPVRYSRISSQYTERRYHPVQQRYRAHRGVDYSAPRGTPVRAVGDGTVEEADYQRYNGNYVKIRHNGVYTSGYLHLSRIEEGIRAGADVSQGETIGYVGSTGMSTGPHLHYQLWEHGSPIDPYSVDLPPSRPVDLQHRETFQQTVQELLPRLERPSAFDERPSSALTARAP